MLKQITNTDKKYVSVPVTDLKLDAAPKVNSFNGITSDAVARAIAGASGEVPQVTENDNGKVLTAVYDESGPAVEWAEAQGGGGETFNPVAENNLVILPDGSYIGNKQDTANDPYFGTNGQGDYDSTYFFCSLYTIPGGYLAGLNPWCYCQDWNYSCTIYIEGYPDAEDYDGYIPVWCPSYSKPSVRLEYIAVHGDQHNITRKCRSVNYPGNLPEVISCSGVKILPPPSAAPDFEVDTTKWNKVGDWSSVNSAHKTWYFGMFNPTTQQWLEFNSSDHRVAVDHGYQMIPRYKVFVDIPAATGADAGKVLKIDSAGKPQWVMP